MSTFEKMIEYTPEGKLAYLVETKVEGDSVEVSRRNLGYLKEGEDFEFIDGKWVKTLDVTAPFKGIKDRVIETDTIAANDETSFGPFIGSFTLYCMAKADLSSYFSFSKTNKEDKKREAYIKVWSLLRSDACSFLEVFVEGAETERRCIYFTGEYSGRDNHPVKWESINKRELWSSSNGVESLKLALEAYDIWVNDKDELSYLFGHTIGEAQNE